MSATNMKIFCCLITPFVLSLICCTEFGDHFEFVYILQMQSGIQVKCQYVNMVALGTIIQLKACKK